MRERPALFWRPLGDGRTACFLCAHRCELQDGRYGVCGARWNRRGTLVSASYGRLAALHVDPIEKKPLHHFHPGSLSLSLASCGCNLRCDFCQNASLSQCREHDADGALEGEPVPPEFIVEQARTRGCASISFTYTEPTIFYEYCRDVGVPAREQGVKSVFVTNGMMTPEAIDDAADSFLDAANVDVKAFTEAFYRTYCHGSLEAVKRSVERLCERGVWVEVTTLVIPGRNDSDEELGGLARWLAGVGRDIPWHLSRFHPDYRVQDLPPTPLERLRTARRIGLGEGLRYVYVGNVPDEEGETTRCPACGAVLVRRLGFHSRPDGLRDGRCKACGEAIAGRGWP